MNNVLLIPELVTNLMSVGMCTDNGKVVVFDKNRCRVFDGNVSVDGNVLFTAPRKQNGLYVLGSGSNKATVLLGESQDDFELWHRRLGHLSQSEMRKLKDIVKGLSYSLGNCKNPCVPCSQGKQCVKKFPKKKFNRASQILELVHSDIAGPIEVESWGGKKYILLLVDDYSRKVYGYLLKCKSEAFGKFREFQALVENQTGQKIKKLRSDNGGEYTSKEFQDHLKNRGIQHQTTVAHTPQQNGVAERTIRTIVEKARCMLAESNLNKRYWGEAVLTAIYLKNRSPTMAISQQVPEQVWTGKAVDLSRLKVFGSKAQVLIKDGSIKKFDPKTRELIFLGYSEDQKGFKFADVKNNPRRIIVARDAVFDERLPNQSKDNMDFLGPPNKLLTTMPNVDVPEEFFVVPITGGTTGAMETEEEVPSQRVPASATGSTTHENLVVESEEFHDSMDSISDSDRSEEREAEPAVEGPRYPQRTRVPNRQEDF